MTATTTPSLPQASAPAPGLFDRTWMQIRTAVRDFGVRRSGDVVMPRPDLPDADLVMLRRQMMACLERRGGEVSARARAAELGRAYLALDATGRLRFLELLAREFDVDQALVDAATMELAQATTPEERHDAQEKVRQALEAPRVRLLTQFNALPDGIKFLVDMRAELLRLNRQHPHLKPLEADLKRVLVNWFDVGFLELKRITWEAPAALLEKLIRYEAVHAIRSWADLKNRLDSDRRCYAFFHPRMPNEPLIFVEIALVNGLAGNVRVLLDENSPAGDPEAADTAIFYSISNAQRGLAGISFGNFLIKRVVADLTREFKNLKTFATLSPIPGFRSWLTNELDSGEDEMLTAGEREAIGKLLEAQPEDDPRGARLLELALSRPDWHRHEELAEAMKAPLMRLCARFLVNAKRRGRAADPVAHFHLSNGSRMERLNWMGDASEKGIAESAGLMINYLYKLDAIEANHEAYSGDGKIVTSGPIRSLARG